MTRAELYFLLKFQPRGARGEGGQASDVRASLCGADMSSGVKPAPASPRGHSPRARRPVRGDGAPPGADCSRSLGGNPESTPQNGVTYISHAFNRRIALTGGGAAATARGPSEGDRPPREGTGA